MGTPNCKGVDRQTSIFPPPVPASVQLENKRASNRTLYATRSRPHGRITPIALRSVLDSVRDVFIRMQRLPPKPYERGGDDPASSSALKSPTPTGQQPLPALQNATLKLGRTRRPGSINWSALRSQEPRAISEVGWRRAFSVLATRSAASRDPRAS